MTITTMMHTKETMGKMKLNTKPMRRRTKHQMPNPFPALSGVELAAAEAACCCFWASMSVGVLAVEVVAVVTTTAESFAWGVVMMSIRKEDRVVGVVEDGETNFM